MRFRACITFEFDAADFGTAARHEDVIRAIFQDLEAQYQGAKIDFHEVRNRTSSGPKTALKKMPRMTGKLNSYEQ